MTYYFKANNKSGFLNASDGTDAKAARLVAVTAKKPDDQETPPSPWLGCANTEALSILDLGTAEGREAFAKIATEVPLYRIAMELIIDRVLFEATRDADRMKGVRQAFAPEEPPESVADSMVEKYAFEGSLRFPIIASRNNLQLIELYLKLFGAAIPEHLTRHDHVAALFGGPPDRLIEKYDGVMWHDMGWVRFDRVVYDADRIDSDPEVTFESYVTRGRTAAEALAVGDPRQLLAAWIQAERVQRALCRDIDATLRMQDIVRLPRWVRADIFRILEREAMKQVFAEGMSRHLNDWAELRRTTLLAEPIGANAKGEVSPLIQQLLNQTLSADAKYSGSAEAFAMQAERRWAEAERLLAA